MEDFIKAGFSVVGTENNPIPQFNSLRELQDFIKNNNLDDEETLKNHKNPSISQILIQTLFINAANCVLLMRSLNEILMFWSL